MKGMSRGKCWRENPLHFWSNLIAKTVFPGITRYAKNVAASGPRRHRTPDTHSNRETSTEMAANSLLGCTYV